MADPWLLRYDACARSGQEIMEAINDRNKSPKSSAVYAQKSSVIRMSISRFGNELGLIRDDLIQSSTRGRITLKEADRRQSMVDLLITKHKHIDLAFLGSDKRNTDRESLFGSAFASDMWNTSAGVEGGGGGGGGGMVEAADRFSNEGLGIDHIRIQQRQIIDEQDRGLEALSRIIGRQRQTALDIGNEVDEQNEIIDDIGNHVDQSNTRLLKETAHIKFVEKKSGVCWMYVVIVVLLIAIIIIAVIPF